MIAFEGIRENLRFIVVETQKQLSSTRDFLISPSPSHFTDILSRDDYIDNLKNIIEGQCYSKINASKPLSKQELDLVRAIHIVGVNLERIADNCINIIEQTRYYDDPQSINRHEHRRFFELLIDGVALAPQCLGAADLATALRICKLEADIDVMYKQVFDQIMEQLRAGHEIENLITTLFIFRYLERMGDSLLNIGEAIVFSIIGEKIKIHQFESLQKNLTEQGYAGSLAEIDFQSIWGTHSGCRVSRVERHDLDSPKAQESIFKSGAIAKVRGEKDSLELWAKLYPGIAPRVLNFEANGANASMLIEYLPGRTLDEVLLNGGPEASRDIFRILEETLRDVWSVTRTPGPIEVDYIGQIGRRLDQVREVHPDFHRVERKIGNAAAPSSARLFQVAAEVERGLRAPFAVMAHGDFNLSNIIYNPDQQRIHFIDLYRSRHADYLQDASVFLISNFRLPIFEPRLRGRINVTIDNFLAFIKNFAAAEPDPTFELRLALALARSFHTSTRFELNVKFAKEMFLRGHYLLDQIFGHHQAGLPPETFRLPKAVLDY